MSLDGRLPVPKISSSTLSIRELRLLFENGNGGGVKSRSRLTSARDPRRMRDCLGGGLV